MQSPTFNEHFLNPANVGDAHEPSFVGRAGSLRCGATARFSIQIGDANQILEAKFRAAGCNALVASLSLLTQYASGITTAEAAKLGQDPQVLIDALPELNSDRTPCLSLACEALLDAVRQYSDAARDEWNGDDPLICTCFCISERTIEQVIRQNSLTTVAEVTRNCYAGGGCGSCHYLIADMIDLLT